jgi:hypothetical protein
MNTFCPLPLSFCLLKSIPHFCTPKIDEDELNTNSASFYGMSMKGQTVPNYRKRKSKKVESNIDLATHNQTLKQLRQLNTGITIYLSILTLNVNRLNSSIKRHCLTNWIKKEDPTICYLQETHLINRNKHRLRMKDWKKIYQGNDLRKQAGVAILISDKVDFKPTLIK